MGVRTTFRDLHDRRILIAEDMAALRYAIVQLLEPTHATFTEVADGTRLDAALRSEHFDLVISDARMPGLDALAVLRRRRAEGDRTPYVIVTGAVSGPARDMRQLEATALLEKPFTREELMAAVNEALDGPSA